MAILVRDDPLSAFLFRVWIDNEEFGFSKISGLQREIETVTYQEGGLNSQAHIFPGAVKNGGTVHLERGSYAGEQFPFYFVGERLKEPMYIEIYNPYSRSMIDKSYILQGLVVKKWEAGELDAMQNALHIDRFDLSYEYLEVSTARVRPQVY